MNTNILCKNKINQKNEIMRTFVLWIYKSVRLLCLCTTQYVRVLFFAFVFFLFFNLEKWPELITTYIYTLECGVLWASRKSFWYQTFNFLHFGWFKFSAPKMKLWLLKKSDWGIYSKHEPPENHNPALKMIKLYFFELSCITWAHCWASNTRTWCLHHRKRTKEKRNLIYYFHVAISEPKKVTNDDTTNSMLPHFIGL